MQLVNAGDNFCPLLCFFIIAVILHLNRAHEAQKGPFVNNCQEIRAQEHPALAFLCVAKYVLQSERARLPHRLILSIA